MTAATAAEAAIVEEKIVRKTGMPIDPTSVKKVPHAYRRRLVGCQLDTALCAFNGGGQVSEGAVIEHQKLCDIRISVGICCN